MQTEGTDRPVRRQKDRTARTRLALIEAAISLLHRSGYTGTSTAMIAQEAESSRGAIIHHFGTRAQLMAAVLDHVYACEHQDYQKLGEQGFDPSNPSDWPFMLWHVLRKPSGVAALEILQAARNDPELVNLVGPTQARIEAIAADGIKQRFAGLDDREALAALRLFTWAIRGLSIAQVVVASSAEIDDAVALFSRIVGGASAAGVLPVR